MLSIPPLGSLTMICSYFSSLSLFACGQDSALLLQFCESHVVMSIEHVRQHGSIHFADAELVFKILHELFDSFKVCAPVWIETTLSDICVCNDTVVNL